MGRRLTADLLARWRSPAARLAWASQHAVDLAVLRTPDVAAIEKFLRAG
jgi:hypothetical protein